MAAEQGFVDIISLGGTIAMASHQAVPAGLEALLSAADLVEAVPQLADLTVPIRTNDLLRLPSSRLGFDEIAQLQQAIEKSIVDGAIGVVVTQGTDTLEETAYLMDLLHRGPAPVAVTGAMRHPGLPGADGPSNLLAAAQVAASAPARDQGVVVVMNNEVHAARSVSKMHSTSVGAFQSPNTGPIGYVVEGTPRFFTRAQRAVAISGIADLAQPNVGLYVPTISDDGHQLMALADACDGIVIAGFGAGHLSDRAIPAVERAVAAGPVILCSRTGAGSVLTNTYSYSGSEADLQQRGVISGGFLSPYKARVLLQVLLASGATNEAVRGAFAIEGSTEFTGQDQGGQSLNQ